MLRTTTCQSAVCAVVSQVQCVWREDVMFKSERFELLVRGGISVSLWRVPTQNTQI